MASGGDHNTGFPPNDTIAPQCIAVASVFYAIALTLGASRLAVRFRKSSFNVIRIKVDDWLLIISLVTFYLDCLQLYFD